MSDHRGQHRVQPGPVGQGRVDERRGGIESPPGLRRQPLREAPDRIVVGEPHRGRLQTPAHGRSTPTPDR